MRIKLGNIDAKYIKVGSGDCTIYLGETLLYSGDTPTPPTPSYKFYAEYSDSTSYSAECDSDTTLTSATTKPSGYDYSNMTDAVIGDCITSIGNNAFNYCYSLSSVTIPNGVTEIGEKAFYYCNALTSIEIPNSVTYIYPYAFQNCGIESITIPTITRDYSQNLGIGPRAFVGCYNLQTVVVSEGTDYLSQGCFSGCSALSSITLPNSLLEIDSFLFKNCTSLSSITIPNGVTIIGQDAFRECTSLTSVTIGSDITDIGSGAFAICSGLTSITVEATTPPTLEDMAFNSTNNCPIYVPAASVETYKADTRWSDYADRIQAIP